MREAPAIRVALADDQALVASGLSNEDIARLIYVSQSTVKTHVARAMAKLGARDRAQLVVIAYESGLIRPGWAS